MTEEGNSYVGDLFDLKKKVVVITGALGQLGREITHSVRQAGCVVIGVDNDLAVDEKVVDENCVYFKMDVREEREVKEIFSLIRSRYGQLDILVNNAGVSCFEPYSDRSEESFDWVMNVNLKGPFFCIREFERIVTETVGSGAIVNIGSIYGVNSPDPRIYSDGDRKNSEVYGATKAGIIQMTRYFAVHMAGKSIRVNCVSPGGILNPSNPQGEDFIDNYSYRCPMGRLANTKEIIGAVLYLSSSAASYTTGQNIVVDGGMSCW